MYCVIIWANWELRLFLVKLLHQQVWFIYPYSQKDPQRSTLFSWKIQLFLFSLVRKWHKRVREASFLAPGFAQFLRMTSSYFYRKKKQQRSITFGVVVQALPKEGLSREKELHSFQLIICLFFIKFDRFFFEKLKYTF